MKVKTKDEIIDLYMQICSDYIREALLSVPLGKRGKTKDDTRDTHLRDFDLVKLEAQKIILELILGYHEDKDVVGIKNTNIFSDN